MSFTRWLSNHLGLSRRPATRRKSPAARPRFRPILEGFEQRWVPSTLTVTNNQDSGTGSLRATINAAHSGDTIVFDPSLDGKTITLTSGELLIKKNLTISGPGAGQLTISGNNASRVFDVNTSRSQVTLSGLTFENGNGVGGGANGQGGAIENLGTLTINNCIITSDPQGGGIDNQTGATLTVNNSTVSNNTGSGINNYGSLTVSGSTISGNSTRGDGGGIENIGGGTLTVTNSTLSNNSGSGGGISNEGGCTATVSGCTLSNNSAGNGGGIRNGGTLTLSDSTLTGNSALNGGGGIFDFGTLTVSASKLTGNSAGNEGGGIWIYFSHESTGTVTVENSSTITGNSAPIGFGADVYNQGVLHVDATSVIGILDGNPPTIPLWAFDRK
jgi:hypothetical protein